MPSDRCIESCLARVVNRLHGQKSAISFHWFSVTYDLNATKSKIDVARG